MADLRDDVQALRDNIPSISVDEAIAALTLTGNNSADLMRIVDYAFDIVAKLGRNSAAQWAALDLIAARVDALAPD
jgi:hypothetical protein